MNGRIPIISYVIVGAIDVAEWLALPEAQQDLSDLLAILFVDINKLAISTVVGSIAAVIAIGLSAPVWGVVAAGIGAAVIVGIILDVVDNAFAITQKVKNLATKLEGAIESFIDTMMEGVASVEEFMTNATPGDGKITGPTDYLMEIDTGIRQYIYDCLRWP